MYDSKVKDWSFIVIIGIVAYVAIDVLLAFLRPDYSLVHNAESDYGRGPYSWVMDINFLLRCGLSLALVKALWTAFPKNHFIRKASYWLVLWAITSGLLAFFADNPYGYPQLKSGAIHLLLAFVTFISIIIGMIVFDRCFKNITSWGKTASLLTVVTVLAILSIILLGHSGIRPHSPGGLIEKIFLGLVLLWEAIVALKLVSAKQA